MGIFSEARRNFIARPDEARGQIVYRYPEKNIRVMTQLTCQPDEMAIFVKEGRVAGKLGPGGTYSLESHNVPFISALLEKVTGGDLFIAEVYFVSTRENPGVRFGGPLGTVTDHVTQLMCDAMVYGDFSVRVLDAEKLIFGLVGSGTALQNGNAFLDWFKAILLKHLSDAVGELGEKGWSLNKMISPHYKLELQTDVLEQIRGEVERYGLQIVQFGNFVLSIPDDAKAELNRRNTAIADDQRRMELARNPEYAAAAQVEMLRNAGVGMAKGGEGASIAGAGLGFGLGAQMAQVLGGAMKGGAAPAQSATCPSCGAATAPGRFCGACGKPMAATCACGAELAAGARFCSSCGKPVAGPRTCGCGAELAAGAKYCGQCGKPA